MREVFDQNILSDLGKLTNFIETVAGSVSLDEGFTIGEIRRPRVTRHATSVPATFIL